MDHDEQMRRMLGKHGDGRVSCPSCGRTCKTLQAGGDGRIHHTVECLRNSATKLDALAEQAKKVNTHDRAFYLRAANESRMLAAITDTEERFGQPVSP